MTTAEIDARKDAVRQQMWNLMDQRGVVAGEGSAHGCIPNFLGAAAAADQLTALAAWKSARVVKAVPDRAQLPARARALHEGKVVYMAAPKVASPQPFYLLDPAELAVPAEHAASSRITPSVARNVGLDELPSIDVIVCGSVAVNRNGVRIGKGAGYSDIEVALLSQAGLIGPATTIVTTVHPFQVIEDDIPETAHDFSVDLIVTTHEVITCARPRRPADSTGNRRAHTRSRQCQSCSHWRKTAIPMLKVLVDFAAVLGVSSSWLDRRVLPGEGIDPGETARDTARREIGEETGLVISELGELVWTRESRFVCRGRHHHRSEEVFRAHVADTRSAMPPKRTANETLGLLGQHWWTLDELDATATKLLPPELPGLVHTSYSPPHPLGRGSTVARRVPRIRPWVSATVGSAEMNEAPELSRGLIHLGRLISGRRRRF